MKQDVDQSKLIEDLNARYIGPNKFEKFDRGVRASLGVSKQAVLKEETRPKTLQAKKPAKKNA